MDFVLSNKVYIGHHSLAFDGEKSWKVIICFPPKHFSSGEERKQLHIRRPWGQ